MISTKTYWDTRLFSGYFHFTVLYYALDALSLGTIQAVITNSLLFSFAEDELKIDPEDFDRDAKEEFVDCLPTSQTFRYL